MKTTFMQGATTSHSGAMAMRSNAVRKVVFIRPEGRFINDVTLCWSLLDVALLHQARPASIHVIYKNVYPHGVIKIGSKSMLDLKEILTMAVKAGASDVHIKTGIVPVIRKHGELHALSPDMKRLSSEQIQELAYSIMSEKQIKQLESMREVDLGYGVNGVGRFRVNIFRQRGSFQMVIRTISDRVPSLSELSLPAVLQKIAMLERGLVLVTGITGSGKSTTLAAMLDYINQNQKRHILTIEDPIEYLMRDRRSIVTQRELGADTDSFATALRAALRQDPDVIMIGEMRDKETIETALLAAETGHLVFSTLHTADCMETINRILTAYEPHQQTQVRIQLASVLKAIISQRLAQRKDARGLVPAVEIMVNTTRTKEMIMKPEKTREILSAIEEGRQTYGMQSFDQSLMQLFSKEVITLDEAVQLSSHPEDFELRFRGVMSADGGKWEDFDINKSGYWNNSQKVEVETAHSAGRRNDDGAAQPIQLVVQGPKPSAKAVITPAGPNLKKK